MSFTWIYCLTKARCILCTQQNKNSWQQPKHAPLNDCEAEDLESLVEAFISGEIMLTTSKYV